MRVLVAGDYRHRVLLDTTKATAILIMDDNDKPNVIFKMLENGKGWVRFTEGEDPNFNSVAKELGLT